MLVISLSLLYLLLIAVVAGVVYLYQRNRLLQTRLEKATKKIDNFEREIKALLRADIVFGKSVTNLKNQLCALDDRQAQLENRRGNDGGYQHALKLLEMGSSVESIIQDCNLTHAEAELLANLQAYQCARGPRKAGV